MYKYKSFISYSRAADSRLAPAIKSALQGFAKPWYKLRSIQVFCDQTNLTANPDLWSSIEKHLGDSEYFIYLASPQAAQSKWVKKEIDFFRSKGSVQKMIIVLTDGTIVWDVEKKDFNWELTDAVPHLKDVVFAHEPTWVDIKWIRKEQLSPRDPRFLDAVANLSATLRDIDKDTLIGQDVEEHRKAKRFRRFSIGGLVLLALFLIAATFLAVQSESRSQERLVKTFTGNGTALLNNGDYLAALPWFVEAMASERNDERKALNEYRVENLFNQAPALVQVWQTALPVLQTAFIASDKVLIVSGDPVNWWTNTFDCFSNDKSTCKALLQVFSTANGKTVFSPITLGDGIRSMAISSDGRLFASLSISNVLRLWNLQDGKCLWELGTGIPVTQEAFHCKLAFNKQSDKLLFVKESSINIYATRNGNTSATYNNDHSTIVQADFLPDGNAVAFLDESLKVWNLHDKTTSIKKLPFFDRTFAFKLSPNSVHMIVAGERDNVHFQGFGASVNGLIAYVDSRNTAEPLFIKEVDDNASHLEFDLNGTALAVNSSNTSEGGSWDNGTRVLNVLNGNPLTGWIRLSQEVNIGFDHSAKKLVISCKDGTTEIWEVGDPSGAEMSNRIYLLHDGNQEVKSIFCPNNKYLLTSGSGRLVKLWEIPDAEAIRAGLEKDLSEEEADDTTLQYSLSYGEDDDSGSTDPGTVFIYDKKTSRKTGAPLKHNSNVYFAEISRDGNLIATAALREACVWRRDNQQKLFSFALADNAAIRTISFSPDSRRVLTSFTDYTARVWDARTGRPITPYIRHPFNANFVDEAKAKFTSDGRKIITFDINAYRIWDAGTGEPLSASIKAELPGGDTANLFRGKKMPFSVKKFTIADIKNYAELLSNQRLDENGSLVPLAPKEYLEKWHHWKAAPGTSE